jgi:hypothetical protein
MTLLAMALTISNSLINSVGVRDLTHQSIALLKILRSSYNLKTNGVAVEGDPHSFFTSVRDLLEGRLA